MSARRTAVKSAAKPRHRSVGTPRVEAEDTEQSESELKAEAREGLARLVLAKRQELQRIQLQAKVQQLAQMRRQMQASSKVDEQAWTEERSRTHEEKQSVASSVKGTRRDQDDAREESRRRMRTLLVHNRLQMLKRQREQETPAPSTQEETLVVIDSDAETKASSKRWKKEAKAVIRQSRPRSAQPVNLRGSPNVGEWGEEGKKAGSPLPRPQKKEQKTEGRTLRRGEKRRDPHNVGEVGWGWFRTDEGPRLAILSTRQHISNRSSKLYIHEWSIQFFFN